MVALAGTAASLVVMMGRILPAAFAESVVCALEANLVRAVMAAFMRRARACPVIVLLLVILMIAATVVLVEAFVAVVWSAAVTAMVAAVVVPVSTTTAAAMPAVIAPVVVEMLPVATIVLSMEVITAAASVIVSAAVVAVVAAELLVLRGAPVLVVMIALVMVSAHTASVPVASTAARAISATADLLAVRWDHSRLVSAPVFKSKPRSAFADAERRYIMHLHLVVAHRSVVSVEVSAAGREWRSSTASVSATSALVVTLVFGLGLLDVNAPAVDLSNRVVLDQVLGHLLICEGHETKASRRSRVDIF